MIADTHSCNSSMVLCCLKLDRAMMSIIMKSKCVLTFVTFNQ